MLGEFFHTPKRGQWRVIHELLCGVPNSGRAGAAPAA
jgi:hypothetical protein